MLFFVFFFQAEDGIRDTSVTGVQTCALPIWRIHAVPWLRTSETPGIERSWASSTASLVSSSTKSDWTRALRAVGDPDATRSEERRVGTGWDTRCSENHGRQTSNGTGRRRYRT